MNEPHPGELFRVTSVPSQPQSLASFTPLVGKDVAAVLERRAAEIAELMAGRTFWNINSTARGGGVAEMLGPLVAYGRGAGVDVRWLVIQGTPEFFAITKRIHNLLHGFAGDGGELGAVERKTYEDVLAGSLPDLHAVVRPGDVVLLHDPQTAGLLPALAAAGADVVWRCHIGTDEPNDHVAAAWTFLQPWLDGAAGTVFTRASYVPEFLSDSRVWLIPPSLDPFSPKNAELSSEQVLAIVQHVGIVAGRPSTPPTFPLRDGTPARVDRTADIVRAGGPPEPSDPLVVQVSRWDRLKDPVGVMRGFAERAVSATDANLALVGPSVAGVADDPEGASVFNECIDLWQRLPSAARRRIQLVTLPMRDADENAAMVNAIQRHATVIAQKSLREGFGLTVAEAMWKSRPVVGAAVGGIVDQVINGETGVLVDPTDLDAFGAAIVDLVTSPERAAAMGKAGHERALAEYIGPRHLLQYADLLTELTAP